MCFSPEDSHSSLRPTLPSRLSLLVSLEKAFFFLPGIPGVSGSSGSLVVLKVLILCCFKNTARSLI